LSYYKVNEGEKEKGFQTNQKNVAINVLGIASIVFYMSEAPYYDQGFGSGSGSDPDSIRSMDSDPYSESGSGSRRAKMTHKSRKS
jgi:hypothetical protein